MSSGRSSKKKYFRGVSREKFDAMAAAGINQTEGDNLDTNFSSDLMISMRKRAYRTNFGTGGPTGRTQEEADKRNKASLAAQEAQEQKRQSLMTDISQKDLDELVVNFKNRQSYLIGRSQNKGREQLILTD